MGTSSDDPKEWRRDDDHDCDDKKDHDKDDDHDCHDKKDHRRDDDHDDRHDDKKDHRKDDGHDDKHDDKKDHRKDDDHDDRHDDKKDHRKDDGHDDKHDDKKDHRKDDDHDDKKDRRRCPPGCNGGIVVTQPGDTLSGIAQRFGVSVDALLACNPGLHHDGKHICPGQKLCLPGDFPTPMCGPGCQGGIYTVQPGDTLFSIAQRFGVALNALIACNPQIPNPNQIFPGQQICLPTGATPLCGPSCQGGIYTVQPGDTLFAIAQRFGVALNALIACNPQIPDPNQIVPGQQICLPTGATPLCGPNCQGGIYTVQPGDTLFAIAQRFGVALNALIACNPQIPNPNQIVPGQQICLPTGATPQCGPGCQGGIYTVQPGDTMFSIAQRFGVSLNALIACNPQIPNPAVIFPGQQLCLPTGVGVQCGPGCQGGIYTVQPGDTMFSIAQRFGVSLNALIACNPQIPNPAVIFPGQQLCLPTGVGAPQCGPNCQGGIYTVQPGDTMFFIAQRFGVSLNALIACNPQIPNPNQISPGQQLCLPSGVGLQCGPGCRGGVYTVQPGDTMFFIAQRFGVSLNALIACNPQIPNPNQISPGQQLCLPG